MREVVAFATPHMTLDEVAGVAVVTQQGHARATLAELRAFGSGLLRSAQLPEVLVVLDAVPRSAGGKLIRAGLAERLMAKRAVSWNQSQLLTVHAADPTSAAYNIPMAVWLDGALDIRTLRTSLAEVVRRHAVLRTTFEVDAELGGFAQRVHERLDDEVLLREEVAADEEAAEALVAADASRGFTLFGAGAGVLRCLLVGVAGAERHLLHVNVHHVAFDGASMGVLLREVCALYAAGGSAEGAGLEAMGLQYVDYALWQRDMLAPLLEPQREYWRTQLHEGALSVLELPLDFARPAVQTFNGAMAAVRLPADVVERLEVLGRAHGCTLFQVVLALWSLLLCRHAGQDEVVIGSPYLGRDAAGTEGLIGYFVNMLALLVEAPRGGSVSALLRHVRDVTAGAMQRAAVPWQMVVHELLPRQPHDASRNAVFQAMLAWGDLAEHNKADAAGAFGAGLGVRIP